MSARSLVALALFVGCSGEAEPEPPATKATRTEGEAGAVDPAHEPAPAELDETSIAGPPRHALQFLRAPDPGLRASAYADGDGELDDVEPSVTRVVPELELLEEAAVARGALRLEGFVHVPATGMRRFVLEGNAGTRLEVAGEALVPPLEGDGVHSAAGTLALQEGWHALVVEWHRGTGTPTLAVTSGPPDGAQEPLAADSLAH